MNSIIEKLSEIESAAISIITNAEEQKKILDTEMEEKQRKFDADLAADTNQKITKIHSDLKSQMEEQLATQKQESLETIKSYKN
ncbi:MAG: hypothetical protein RR791_03575 [Lachnospiraceae bacterium]